MKNLEPGQCLCSLQRGGQCCIDQIESLKLGDGSGSTHLRLDSEVHFT